MKTRFDSQTAPAPKLTTLGVALLASVIALPGGLILWFGALFWP